MSAVRRRAASGVTFALAALMAACALVPRARGPEAGPPAWALPPAVWRIRQVVLIELGEVVRYPVQGYLEFDAAAGRVRLVGLDDFGTTFFRLTVTAQGESVDFMLPLVPHGEEVARSVARSLRRIYLGPAGAAPGAGETRLEAGPAGQIVSAASRNGDGWQIRYEDYRDEDGTAFPHEIRYQDREGVRLTIRQVSMRRVDR